VAAGASVSPRGAMKLLRYTSDMRDRSIDRRCACYTNTQVFERVDTFPPARLCADPDRIGHRLHERSPVRGTLDTLSAY